MLFRLTILSGSGSLGTDSTILPFPDLLDSVKIEIIQPANMEFPSVPDEDIFDAQMAEAKAIYAEAVISDLTGDTLEGTYQYYQFICNLYIILIKIRLSNLKCFFINFYKNQMPIFSYYKSFFKTKLYLI